MSTSHTDDEQSKPITVLLTGAAGQIAYSLIPYIASGQVFGNEQSIVLHLLDIPPMKGVMDGVVMEIEDCAYRLLRGIYAFVEQDAAFKNVDAAFLVGSMPRREGMERKDLLAANVRIFKSQGQALANHSNKDVKVLVVGNPANTNALIAAKYAAPKLNVRQFSAMTRLDQNRTASQLAKKHNIARAAEIENVIIWGNHSSTQFPDVSKASYKGKELGFDRHDNELISLIQKRGASVIAARKLSSAMSAAKAAADHMRDFYCGSNKVVSMAVHSNGEYGSPKGVFFSFPVLIDPSTKQWSVVSEWTLDETAKDYIAITGKELVEERDDALEATH